MPDNEHLGDDHLLEMIRIATSIRRAATRLHHAAAAARTAGLVHQISACESAVVVARDFQTSTRELLDCTERLSAEIKQVPGMRAPPK